MELKQLIVDFGYDISDLEILAQSSSADISNDIKRGIGQLREARKWLITASNKIDGIPETSTEGKRGSR